MIAVEKRYHKDLLKDFKSLDARERGIVLQKIDAIASGLQKGEPLSGAKDCFKVRMGDLRLVYVILVNEIWFLIVDRRGRVYEKFQRRYLQIIREASA